MKKPELALLLISSSFCFFILEIFARIDGKYSSAYKIFAQKQAAPAVRHQLSDRTKTDLESVSIIHAIGDSFTHGTLESPRSSWVYWLNKSVKPLEAVVYNLGKSGTNVKYQCQKIKEVSRYYPNSIIIHQLFVNDFYGKEWEGESGLYSFQGKQAASTFGTYGGMHISYYINKAIITSPIFKDGFLSYTLQFQDTSLPHWESILSKLKSCYEVAKKRNIKILTFLHPSLTWKRSSVNGGYSYPYETFDKLIVEELSSSGIDVDYLYKNLRQAFPNAYDFWLSKELPDAHPNQDMQKFTANLIRDLLLKKGYL